MNRFSLNDSMSMVPSVVPPSAWTGHLPFAFWVSEEVRPRIFVELGSHNGTSYLGFCQTVARCGLETRCFAVDTWRGDEHSGFYGEDVFQTLSSHNDASYAGFSQLMRMTFDDALAYFADGSVDLLHIDGLHTYDAVKHDFDTWLPKLSSRGVVLFHDTMVRERGFGVWKLWAELRERYPAFEFRHSHGLGVLLTGPEQPQALRDLVALGGSDDEVAVQCLFEALGARILGEERARLAEHFGDIARAEAAHHLAQGEQAYRLLAEEREVGAARMTEVHGHAVAMETAFADAEKRRADERIEAEAARADAEKRRVDERIEAEAVAERAREALRDEHARRLAALNDEIAALRRDAETQGAQARERIAVLQAERDAARAESAQAIAELRSELRAVAQSQRWDELFATQQQLQQRIEAIEQAFASRAADDVQRIAALEGAAVERQAELAKQAAKAGALETQLDMLYASTSWKITRPARWLYGLLTGRSR
jgi:hypothetical protein